MQGKLPRGKEQNSTKRHYFVPLFAVEGFGRYGEWAPTR
jgi:hypothetical protein